ncbi:hypothetical protein NDU88_008832 [Pleurodeles waltl]|uniref:Uncharacterized protein n=1 Tax=Pleurodeles waltl TaxID=8319 RepID=A0AAV7QVR1_PLEWA|nr:hypothetical protein NDU88_008832 [Pleurodeles waltl]
MEACSAVGAARLRWIPPGVLLLGPRIAEREGNFGDIEAMPLPSSHAQASSGVLQKMVLVPVIIRRVAGLILCGRPALHRAHHAEVYPVCCASSRGAAET